MEIWGKQKTVRNPVLILHKRATRIVNRVDDHDPLNILFIKSHALKFRKMHIK